MGRGPQTKPRQPWLTRHRHVTGSPSWVYSIQVYRTWRSHAHNFDPFEYDVWAMPEFDDVWSIWTSPVVNMTHDLQLSVALVDMDSRRAKQRSRRRVAWSDLPDRARKVLTDPTTEELITACRSHK